MILSDLVKYLMTRSIARFLCNSRASCKLKYQGCRNEKCENRKERWPHIVTAIGPYFLVFVRPPLPPRRQSICWYQIILFGVSVSRTCPLFLCSTTIAGSFRPPPKHKLPTRCLGLIEWSWPSM